MKNKLLALENISKSFPGVLALDDVSVDLYSGEVLGLLGENGAGKSTLMKILAGDYSKDDGEISISGEHVDFKSPHDAQQLGIRIIYQELNTLDTLSVAENIFVGSMPLTKLKTIDWKKLNADAGDVLKQMGSSISPKTIMGDLTIHEKQVVEIAKAIYKKATILVMDEPTAALGEKDTESLFAVINNLKSQGVGIIYISHRLDEIFQITDRITVMRDGKKVDTIETSRTNKDELVSMMVGRKLSEFYPKTELPIGETLLEVKGMTIEGILEDVSFNLRSGEILGIFGLAGSGRLNVVRALYGIESIDSGEIKISGKPVVIDSPDKAMKSGIGFMPVDRKLEGLALELSVSDNITMANIDNTGSGFFLNKKLETERANKWVADVNIKTPSLKTEVNTLSGGNQQKIVLAKMLETAPKIFIMNEPTRGIDVGAKIDIYQITESLCKAGDAVIMLSSEMPEIISMADRIIVISDGKITAEFDRNEATQEKLLHAATV